MNETHVKEVIAKADERDRQQTLRWYDIGEKVCFFVAVLMIGFGLGFIVNGTQIIRYKKEAIEHGYAQHNPITGDWEWKEPPYDNAAR